MSNTPSRDVRELILVVDEIFSVLEDTRELLDTWKSYYHTPFIDKMFRLQELRQRLYKLGYSDEFVDNVVKIAYRNVFIKTRCLVYNGSKDK